MAQTDKKGGSRPAIMNQIWFWLIALSVLAAAFTGKMEAVTKASFDSAKTAVTLAIGLIGAMALWLGLVKVVEEAGLLKVIAARLKGVLVRLFPDVPPEHPAMSAMVMNLSANALGLGNAATPLGIKAMVELDRLNPIKGRATDAMCLFLAINTSNVTLLPLGVIGVRAAAGASEPASILLPTLFATAISTLVAVVAAKSLARISGKGGMKGAPKKEEGSGHPEGKQGAPDHHQGDEKGDQGGNGQGHGGFVPGPLARVAVGAFFLALLFAAAYRIYQGPWPEALKEIVSFWLIPVIMLAFVSYGWLKGVAVYEAACEGAKEGFQVAVRIIPFLVMILVAVGMFRASGAFGFLASILSPVTTLLGFPAEVLPVALLRPLSGSGAFGLMSEIVARAPDSFAAYLASTLQGSTETTFYVLAVYFGAVGIKDARYAVAAALAADLAGALAALFICRLTF
jgi:spore maturation protein SpmA